MTIAEAIGRGLGLPVTSIDPAGTVDHLGFIGQFFAFEMSSETTETQRLLGWTPTGPTLLEDLDSGAYTAA